MESTGEADRIHISCETASLLSAKGTHIVDKRGIVNVKGLGEMSTFWLNGATKNHAESNTIQLQDLLIVCQDIIDQVNPSTLGFYHHVMDDDLSKMTVDIIDTQGISAASRDNELFSDTSPLRKSISFNKISELEDDNCSISRGRAGLTGITTLIICDCTEIRIPVLYLIKSTFKVENTFSISVDMKDAISKLSLNKFKFDIILVEKNLYARLDDGNKEILNSLLLARERLNVLIVPDCDYNDNTQYDVDFLRLDFPLQSIEQVTTTLSDSDNTYGINLLCREHEEFTKDNNSFQVLVISASIATGKLISKQIKSLLSEMKIACKIVVVYSAVASLDACNQDLYDLIFLDNALILADVQTCEILEFLRCQPQARHALIIVLTKSVLSSNSALLDSGADLIWPKPLPNKEILKSRLSRVCKHPKFKR
jgi:CheY-like chemotaxis protein